MPIGSNRRFSCVVLCCGFVCCVVLCAVVLCGVVCRVRCVVRGVCSRFSCVLPRPLRRTSPPDSPPPDRPKCRSLFPFPATIFFLSSLSWGCSRGILVVFLKAGTLKCARLEFLVCRVKPRAHFRAPALQNTTRRPPREGRKKDNCGGRGKKKREMLGLPPFGPHLGAPLFGALPFRGPPFGAHPQGAHVSGFVAPFEAPLPFGALPIRSPLPSCTTRV